jgi:hypothetical protein
MLDRIGRAVHRSRNLSIQQLLRLQYPVGNPFWLANACMNRVSRAIAARARMCLLAELHRHATSITAKTRCCFEIGSYLHCYPNACYIGYEVSPFFKKDFSFFPSFSSHIDMAFPNRDIAACEISVSPTLGKD